MEFKTPWCLSSHSVSGLSASGQLCYPWVTQLVIHPLVCLGVLGVCSLGFLGSSVLKLLEKLLIIGNLGNLQWHYGPHGQGQVALSSAPTVYSCREEVGGRLMLREKLKPPVAAGLVPLWMETSATLLVVTATGFQLLFQEGIPGWLEYKALWTVYWSPCSYLSNTDNRDPPSTWELGALFSCLSLKWPQVSLQSAAQSCVGSSL